MGKKVFEREQSIAFKTTLWSTKNSATMRLVIVFILKHWLSKSSSFIAFQYWSYMMLHQCTLDLSLSLFLIMSYSTEQAIWGVSENNRQILTKSRKRQRLTYSISPWSQEMLGHLIKIKKCGRCDQRTRSRATTRSAQASGCSASGPGYHHQCDDHDDIYIMMKCVSVCL